MKFIKIIKIKKNLILNKIKRLNNINNHNKNNNLKLIFSNHLILININKIIN